MIVSTSKVNNVCESGSCLPVDPTGGSRVAAIGVVSTRPDTSTEGGVGFVVSTNLSRKGQLISTRQFRWTKLTPSPPATYSTYQKKDPDRIVSHLSSLENKAKKFPHGLGSVVTLLKGALGNCDDGLDSLQWHQKWHGVSLQ